MRVFGRFSVATVCVTAEPFFDIDFIFMERHFKSQIIIYRILLDRLHKETGTTNIRILFHRIYILVGSKQTQISVQVDSSLATSGSVSFNFERKGQIVVPSEGVDFDKLFETAAEAGAEDVTDDGEVFTVVTGPSDLFTVRKALQEAGFDYDSADQVMQPKNEVELSLEDARKVSKLIDNLDDLDDVQNIYSNWTASDEVMAQLDEE